MRKSNWLGEMTGVMILVLAGWASGPAHADTSGLSVTGYEPVGTVAVGRTHFDLSYRVTVSNTGPALSNVSGSLSSSSPLTVVIDGEVSFGDVGAGAAVQGTDTFTIRQDRRFVFDPSVLSWSFTADAANTPPVADAGPDQTVPLGTVVTLDGSGSSDADGDPLSFAWVLFPPPGSLAVLSDPAAVMPTFVADLPGSYTAVLIVNDGSEDSAPDSVTVSTLNSPPVADAGPDQTVPLGALVLLSGAGSSDPDGDDLTFAWSLVARPDDSSAALISDNTVETSFVADAAGEYRVQLVVSDGFSSSEPAEVRISTENSRPVADAGPDQSVPVGAVVTLDGSASSDADGDELAFAWSFTSLPAGSTAMLAGAETVAPQFTADVAGLYVAQLIVSDDELDSTPDTVRIEAAVPGDHPPEIISTPVTSAILGQGYTYAVVAIDPDPGDVLSFSLPQAPPGMSIHPASGLVSWTPPDTTAVTVIVQVTDSTGLTDVQPFFILVRESEEDQPPTLEPIANQVIALGETLVLVASGSDPEGQPLRYTVSGPAGMGINSLTGELQWRPTATQVGVSLATVSVSDPGGQGASRSFGITVLEEAENTPPSLEPVPDQAVFAGNTLSIQLAGSDPDPGDVLSYGVVSGPAGLTVDPNNGVLGWIPGPDQAGVHPVTVQVVDLAGASASQAFEVTVGLPPVPPIAVDDAYGIKRGSILQPSVLEVQAPGVLGNDESPSGLAMSAELLDGPTRGTLSAFHPDGSFSYTPDVAPPREIEFVEVCNSLEALGGQSRSIQQYPVVVDLDGDGVPEIIWLGTTNSTTQMYAISVRNGHCELLWQTGAHGIFTQNPDYGILYNSTPHAAGDVTGDGRPEIVVVMQTYPCSPQPCSGSPRPQFSHFALFNADGEFLWVSEPVSAVDEFDQTLFLRDTVPHIADLTGDGRGEIVFGVITSGSAGGPGSTNASMVVAFRHVEDPDGTLRGEVLFEARGTPSVTGTGQHTAVHVVDLDLDGVPEILFENDVFSNSGELLYSLPVPGHFAGTFNPAAPAPRTRSVIVNLDNDPFPEIVVKANSGLYAFKHDGTEIWRRQVTSGVDAPLTAADLTGDGWPEIVFQDSQDFHAYDRFGERLWTSEPRFVTTDRLGSTAFDFNGNGRSEVVIARTDTPGNTRSSLVVILDGETGEVLAEMPATQTNIVTQRQIPVLADVTGDGRANIVLWQDGIGTRRVIVLGGTEANPWGPARPIWNQNTYHATNINTDGTLPTPMRPHWLLPGLNAYHVNVPLPGEDDSGRDSFTYRALAGGLASEPATVNLDITANVNPPRIVSTPVTAASPGFEYRYGVLAIDADLGDQLSFALATAPAGMTISGLGIVEWLPLEADVGTRTVSISVTDSTGLSDVQTFALEVGPPVFVPELLGLAETAARDVLSAAGLAAGTVSRRYDLGVEEGNVLSQALPAGSPAALGTRVNFSVSLGPQPLQVPNLVGLSRSVALATLQEMGLDAGLVTRQNSDTVGRNQVLSQSLAPGQRILAGSTLDLVISSGPALLVELERELVGAGEDLLFAVTLFDAEGNPQLPTPPFTTTVVAGADTEGPAPLPGMAAVGTDAATRGEWVLRVELGAHVRELPFLVLGHAGPGSSLEPFAEFSSQLNAMERELMALIDAIENGNLGAVPMLAGNLQAIRNEVDPELLRLSSLMALEDRFLPHWSAISSFPLTDGERAWLNTISTSIFGVEALEGFMDTLLAGRARNDDLRGRALVEAAAASLDAMNAGPPQTRTLVLARDSLWRLSSWSYPRAVLAGTDRVLTELDRAGLVAQVPATPRDFYARTADASRWQSPAAFYAQRHEVFFSLAGLMTTQVNMVSLAEKIYLPVVKKLLAATGPLITGGLLVEQVGASNGAGVITGASLSFHNFCVGNSILESRGFGPFAEQNTVIVVGPDLFNEALNFADGLKDKNVQDAAEAAGNFREAMNRGDKSVPGQSLQGCFLDGASDCRQLVFPDGIESVYTDTGNPFPSPILFFIYNSASSGMQVITAPFFSAEGPCTTP